MFLSIGILPIMGLCDCKSSSEDPHDNLDDPLSFFSISLKEINSL